MGLRACLAGKRRGEKGKLDRNGRFGLAGCGSAPLAMAEIGRIP